MRDMMIAAMADILERPVDQVNEETVLEPWDSILALETITVIDDFLGRPPEGEKISACKTVGDVLKIVEGMQ